MEGISYEQEKYSDRKEEENQKVQVVIAKNRHGATGIIELGWTPQFTAFYSLDTVHGDDEE